VRTHATDVPYSPGRLDDLLRAAAARDPDRPALMEQGTTVTFAALDAWADAVATAIRSADPQPGPTALPLSLSAQTVALYYGLVRARQLVVLLNPLLPPSALARNMAAVGVTRIIADRQLLRRLATEPVLAGVQHVAAERSEPTRTTLRPWDAKNVPPIDPPRAPVEPHGSDRPTAVRTSWPVADRHELQPVEIRFTSGTTGRPKAVELSHRAVTANAWQMSTAHEINGSSVVLCHLPMLNPMHTNACIFAGATQVLCLSSEISDTAELADQCGVTHYYSQPVRLDALARDPSLRDVTLPHVRYIAAGSRALAPEVVGALVNRFGAHVFQGYGQTETCYLSHSDSPHHPAPGSVGFGLPGTETRITDPASGKEVPPGVVGQLEIRGPQLMNRYLNRPDLEPFTPDGWFRSGDVARLDTDGRVYVLDRMVDVAHRDGRVISPSRLERELEREPYVRHAGVVLIEDGGRPRVHAFVTLLDRAQRRPAGPIGSTVRLDLDDLRAKVNAGLLEHEHVDVVTAVDEIPRLPVNGKVDRKVLARWAVAPEPTLTV